ncbi:serine/threonine protein kinase [Chondrocystis sp. NIES-4102]|nr:serine/threonine protein kinase [Chondrocystis sp. NIES-4102]
MSVLKIAKELKLLEKQLREIETQVSDPIERLEHKKLLEKKIKKLERLKSQQEEYERQQQELEELKSEFSPDNSNSVEHLQEISTSVNNKINSQPQHNLNQQFNSTVNSDNKITSKHLFIIGIIFSCVSATALIINYSLSKQAEEIRLKNLAQQQAQQAIKVQPEAQAQIQGLNLDIDNTVPKYLFLSERKVTPADLINQTPWELDIMRNEIYARHGRKFNLIGLQQYFNKQPWYHPIYTPEQFDNNLLSSLEKHNATVILNYQKQHNLLYF